RLRRLNIDKVKVFASYTTIDLRDEVDAIERGERPARRVIAVDAVDADSGEVIGETGDTLTDTMIRKLRKKEISKVQVFVTSGRAESMLIKNTIAKDPTHTEEEALKQIYSLLRPGDAPNRETAKQALERLFFSPKRYDLGRVGRYKINQRLGLTTSRATTVLTKEDFVAILRYLVELHEGRGHVDDIDHLGNRRIRSVGELIANQSSVGMCPIETPEGPNIGLITSLACYARVNDLGFVETPYLIVKNGKVTQELAWLDANREEDVTIAQANAKVNPDGTFVDEYVLCRQRSD